MPEQLCYRTVALATLVLTIAALIASCGGDNGSSPTSPTVPIGPPVDTNTITIAGGSVSPRDIRVASGTRVTIVNNDSRSHDMNSDPHPEHTSCPAINFGLIQPGQSRESAVVQGPRTCSFHDHNLPDTNSLKGTIQIQ